MTAAHGPERQHCTDPIGTLRALEDDDMGRTTTRRLVIVAVKSFHKLIWALVEAAVGYLLLAGLTKHSDRRAAAAGVVVAAESIVYLANGARCPLTGLAESLGAEGGSVTDRGFYERKPAEGKTKKEAIRALKRRLSDVVYRHLQTDQQPR